MQNVSEVPHKEDVVENVAGLARLSMKAQMMLLSGMMLLAMVVLALINLYSFTQLGSELQETARIGSLSVKRVDTARSAQVHFKKQVQEWKNILLRGTDPKAYEKHLKAFDEDAALTQSKLKDLLAIIENAENIERVKSVLAEHAQMLEQYKAALKHFDREDRLTGQKVDALVEGVDRKATNKIDEVVVNIIQFAAKKAAAQQQHAAETGAFIRNLSVALFALILAATAALALLITRSLLAQIGGEPRYAVQCMHRIASGDMSGEIKASSADSLLGGIRTMQDDLKNMIVEILKDAKDLGVTAARLSTDSTQVAESSGKQSDATSSMAAAVEELTVSINHVSDRANDGREISELSGKHAAEGRDVIGHVLKEMEEIAVSVKESQQIIGDLDARAEQINSIVNAIKEIADQTNLLALNAAIEAARAGEQGRGFAVVADEVRSLAERTARSTQEINTMTHDIREGTGRAVESMKSSVLLVEKSVAMAGQANTSIGLISEGASRTADTVSEITNALKEQSDASQDIARRVETVAQTSEENNATAKDTAATALHLEQLAIGMQAAVSRFVV